MTQPEPVPAATAAPVVERAPAPIEAPRPTIQAAKLPTFAQPQQPAPAAAATAGKAGTDDEYGGINRMVFVVGLIVVSVLGAVVGLVAKSAHNPLIHVMLPVVWGGISVIVLFILTQLRLLNLGYNEWMALLWAAPVVQAWLVGGCMVLPEGFKDKSRRDPETKSRATKMHAMAVVVGVVFFAVAGTFLFCLLRKKLML
jgi:hypothetical protein